MYKEKEKQISQIGSKDPKKSKQIKSNQMLFSISPIECTQWSDIYTKHRLTFMYLANI